MKFFDRRYKKGDILQVHAAEHVVLLHLYSKIFPYSLDADEIFMVVQLKSYNESYDKFYSFKYHDFFHENYRTINGNTRKVT